MKNLEFEKTKGQSAIEYLMTYGWMLLVVAIVGGAIFATVQGQCAQSSSGFTGTDVIVEDFGASGGDLQIEVRNGGSNTLEINEVRLGEDNQMVNDTLNVNVGVGSSDVVVIEGDAAAYTLESSDGCNDIDLEFEYDQGQLTDQITSGSLTDSFEFVDNS